MTPEEAVARLDAISGQDPEADHSEADGVLLEVLPDEVVAAYLRLLTRARWWATA